MRTEQLQYFLKVAQTGSMRIAADMLFVSQPALSNGIKQLEKELGYPLFNRSHNGVTLTEEGSRAIPIVIRALEGLDSLARIQTQVAKDGVDRNVTGQLKLLTVHSQTMSSIPALSRYFKFHYPRLSFFVFEKSNVEVLDGIASGDYDLGLISLNSQQATQLNLEESMTLEMFDREQAYIRVRKDSVLASEKMVTLEQLLSFPLVIANSSLADEFSISKIFGDMLPQNVVLQTNNHDLIDSFCLENDCAIPYYQFALTSENGLSEQYKLIPIVDVLTDFYAVYDKNHPQVALLQEFVYALRNYYHFKIDV